MNLCEEKRLRQHLENVSIGDKKPSALLREMRELSCGKISEELLRTLWIQRLPSTTKAILSVSEDIIEKLALMADKIYDQSDSVASVSLCTEADRLSCLEKQIQDRQRRTQRYSRSSSRNRNKSFTSSALCWYHKKFGAQATKCRSPCDFNRSGNH
ncbi:uncharacterized protein LOC142225077 [Haematobia irritans]|uniref:uncharacterized protein LOC142225077 n=1 Tax=Haematobia irritans TaxID=7368 RepID=UPI003F4F7348